jgi:hypothetical protein
MFFNINFKLKYAGESINIDEEILENVDTDKFGKKRAKHYIRYRTKNIYNTYFKDESVTAQAQLLLSLLKSRKLKEATSLLGIQKSTKDTKVQQNVFNNISGLLKVFGKSRKENIRVARKTLQTTIVSGSNIKDRLTRHMAKTLGTSRKTLGKHRKFRFQIDANDELACWTMISRQPYKDRLAENVKELARNCWLEESRVSPHTRDVLRRRIARNQYEEHPKHILPMTQIELFNKFKEEHKEVKISINTFVQQKPWFVRPITVRDTCCCRYHVEFELYYDTFSDFGKTLWPDSPPPSTVRVFISEILCERGEYDLFYQKKCIGGKKCDRCGNLSLFHSKYHIDTNDQSFSNIRVDWKRYEYLNSTTPQSSNVISKRLDLKVDKICLIEFLKKFEEEIYKYTKHSHRARWQDLQFKQSREVFPPGTILSVVDFAENYTFAAQKEIQSEYYHSDQVTIFVHVLYRHAQRSLPNIENTDDDRHVIKEYHFYISDDRTHDTHYVQHCFDKFYDSLKEREIIFDRHWIWSDGCAGQFKSARSFYWLCRLHKRLNITHCWNFFETGDGKGEHDGAGACIKRALRRYQLNPHAGRFESAIQVVQWCNMALSHECNPSRDVRRCVYI